MGQRAVSPVMGMVILAGLTAIVGLSVVVVGITVVDGAQSSAETTQAENSMAEFASTANDIATSRSQSNSFSFVGDDDGATWVDESAGQMELVVENGSDVTTIPVGDLGVYRHETSDGTEIAYQAGGVWRVDDGKPSLIAPPNLDFRVSGNTSTLQFPIVTVTGDSVGGGSVDGDATVVDRSALLESTNLSNPIHGDELEVRLSSRYCEGWEAYVSETTPATTTESCGDGTSDRLVFAHSLPDEPVEGEENETDDTEWWAEDAVRTSADFEIEGRLGWGTDGEIAGNVSHGGSFSTSRDVDVTHNQSISPSDETHDSEIQSRIVSGSNWRPLCTRHDGNGPWRDVSNLNCSFTAGTHYIDRDTLMAGPDKNVTLDVSAGNVTLVLDDDLVLNGPQGIKVVGHDSTDNVARIYTPHDITFQNHGHVGPPNPASFTSPSTSYDGDPEALQIFGSSHTDLTLKDSVHFEGIYDAPAGDSGTSMVTDDGGSDFYIAGALRTGEFEITSGSYYHSYSDSLSDLGGDNSSSDDSTNSSDRSFYLHASETQIEVGS